MPEFVGTPCNLSAEQSTLGSMMLEKPALDIGLGMLTAADFYRPSHQMVFTALAKLAEKDAPPDLITTQDKLREMGKFEDVGGTDYLMALVETVPTAVNVEHYAKIVRRCSILRRQQAIGCELQAMVAAGNSDPDEVQAWLSSKIDSLNLEPEAGMTMMRDLLMGHQERITAMKDLKGVVGYTSGFSHIDTKTGGFGGPLYVLLKADRGQGKTHHLVQCAANCVRSGRTAAIFSLDTPIDTLIDRFLAHHSGVNSFRIRRPHDDDWGKIANAQAWYWNQPIALFTKADVTIRQIRTLCRSLVNQGHNLGLVAIDYAELLGYDGHYSSHEQEIAEVARGIKNLRDELETTILLLSQVNSEGQERWSRSLGNLADIVMSSKKDGLEENGKGRLILQSDKNRVSGNFRFECQYDFGTSRIRETSLDYSDPTYPPSWPWWYDPSADEGLFQAAAAPCELTAAARARFEKDRSQDDE